MAQLRLSTGRAHLSDGVCSTPRLTWNSGVSPSFLRVSSPTNTRADVLPGGLHPSGLVRRRRALSCPVLHRLKFRAKGAPHQFTEPVLPRFLDEIVLRGLTVDGRKANVALRRSNRHVVVDVLDKDDSIGVVTSS